MLDNIIAATIAFTILFSANGLGGDGNPHSLRFDGWI
jgi:hypothetical protein